MKNTMIVLAILAMLVACGPVSSTGGIRATSTRTPKPTRTATPNPGQYSAWFDSRVLPILNTLLEGEQKSKREGEGGGSRFGCWRGSPRDEPGIRAWGTFNRALSLFNNESAPTDAYRAKIWRHLGNAARAGQNAWQVWYDQARCAEGLEDGAFPQIRSNWHTYVTEANIVIDYMNAIRDANRSAPAATPVVDDARPSHTCSGSKPTRLTIGMSAHVSYDPPEPNTAREGPGTKYEKIGLYQVGENLVILDGPKCGQTNVGELMYWKVKSQDTGLVGWTAESDLQDYWLIPE